MTFGSYSVVREIGKGGMSEVYEVENVRLGSRHALKLFTYSGDIAEVRDRFLAEGKLLARLLHPRVVRVTDVGMDESSNRPYFVMDLIVRESGEPCTLADVSEGGADERKIARWYEDLREGLAFIHGKGVIHRDLKLQNVLIGPDGHAVITDFGISKITDKNLSDTLDPVQTIVRMRDGKNPVMGSLGYMAPELEMGQPASAASDIYALGVIVFKLLTGTWCDARTDVRGALEGYNPVWSRILPKLLHSNPQGRECPSFYEELERDRKASESAAEAQRAMLRTCGEKARRLARCLAVAVFALGAGWAWTYVACRRETRGLRMELHDLDLMYSAMDFDALFSIPDEAGHDEVTDGDGTTVMPSRSQFKAAQIDALVLTHGVFSDLKAGNITLEKAIRDFSRMRNGLTENALESPFDKGPEGYMQVGDDRVLYMMLGTAIDRMREVAGEKK